MGVQHFVYVSAIGVSADNPIDFFRIKHGTEETLKSSGLPYSIVRGAAFMETQIELNAPQLLQKQKALVFGRGDKRSNFVSVVDVARFVVLALQDARLLNRTITVGGPENLTRNQVLDLYENIMDTKIKRSRMPVPLLRLLSASYPKPSRSSSCSTGPSSNRSIRDITRIISSGLPRQW